MRAVGASEAKRPHTENVISVGDQPLTQCRWRNLKSGAIYGELSARISYPCKVCRFQYEIQMAEYSTAGQPYIASDPDHRDGWRADGEMIVFRARKRQCLFSQEW
jgi:hypothetical protein